jgi:hypothetical protein
VSVTSGVTTTVTLESTGRLDFTANGSVTATESGGGTPTTTNTAVLIDGVVEGLEYFTTSGISGLTSEKGQFSYGNGDQITFKVGGVVLGTATTEDVVSGQTFLQDIADVERTDLGNDYVQNMATFLQSLDTNHDSSDGIQISATVRQALSGSAIDLQTATETEVQQLVESVGGSYIEEGTAMVHVRDMLVNYTALETSDFEANTPEAKDDSLSAMSLLELNAFSDALSDSDKLEIIEDSETSTVFTPHIESELEASEQQENNLPTSIDPWLINSQMENLLGIETAHID